MNGLSAPLSPRIAFEDKDRDADPGDEVLLEKEDVNHADDCLGPRGEHGEDQGYADCSWWSD